MVVGRRWRADNVERDQPRIRLDAALLASRDEGHTSRRDPCVAIASHQLPFALKHDEAQVDARLMDRDELSRLEADQYNPYPLIARHGDRIEVIRVIRNCLTIRSEEYAHHALS